MMILLGFVLILTLPYILTRNHGWFDFTETGQIGDTYYCTVYCSLLRLHHLSCLLGTIYL